MRMSKPEKRLMLELTSNRMTKLIENHQNDGSEPEDITEYKQLYHLHERLLKDVYGSSRDEEFPESLLNLSKRKILRRRKKTDQKA